MSIDIIIFAFSTFFLAYNCNIPARYILVTTILFSACGIYVLSLKGYYKIEKYKFYLKDTYLLFEGIILAGIIPCGFLLFFDFDWSVLKFFVKDAILVYILIYIWRKLVYYYRKYLQFNSNILIIGTGEAGKIIADEIFKRPMLKLNLVGFVDNDEDSSKFDFNGLKIIGKTSELTDLIAEYNIKKIVVAITNNDIESQTFMDISECVSKGVDIWKMHAFYERIT